ncbi:MAG TPA: nitroreductase [Caulobacteraceae bacterium]|nr:nitroreductase [Caulobacteraceae bacterium]
MDVREALLKRVSVRVFKPDPVPLASVREILDVARYAPSGGNLQPWRVIVVAGEARQAVIDVATQAMARGGGGEEGERPVYPENLWEPFRSRRFKVGEDMYALLGIPREDRPARFAHLARNYQFFDAPVGLFFVIDRGMGHGQWAHLGMFMQSIALAAVEQGLATCMQEAWVRVRETLAGHFKLAPQEMIYCGMALGRADESAPVNTLRSDRASLDEIAEFHGF